MIKQEVKPETRIYKKRIELDLAGWAYQFGR